MIGQTISHYRIVEDSAGVAWASSIRPKTSSSGASSPSNSFRPKSPPDPQSLGRFQREARAASALNHPNICTIHEINEDAGQTFIVMEYLEGVTLRHASRPSARDRSAAATRDRDR